MTAIATIGFGGPGSIAGVTLLGFSANPSATTQPGGFLTPEQARKAMRKVQRARDRREERRAELLEAAYEAETYDAEGMDPQEAIAPVRAVIEADLGMPILLDPGSFDDMLAQLAAIDRQWGALNQQREDDAAFLLLM